MFLPIVLLLTAASVLCHTSMVIAFSCESNTPGYDCNNSIDVQLQKQQQQLQQQQLTEQLRRKMQQQLQQQMLEEADASDAVKEQKNFEGFDFANLQQLFQRQQLPQHMSEDNDNNNNKNNNHNNNNNDNSKIPDNSYNDHQPMSSNQDNRNNKYNSKNYEKYGLAAEEVKAHGEQQTKQQQHQQQQQQQKRGVYDNNEKNFLYENNKINSEINLDRNYPSSSINDHANNQNHNNNNNKHIMYGALPLSHQDVNNDFRLQLSDLNEPVGFTHSSRGASSSNTDSTNNSINNSNKDNNMFNTASGRVPHDNYNNENNDNNGDISVHSISERSKSSNSARNINFANGKSATAVPFNFNGAPTKYFEYDNDIDGNDDEMLGYNNDVDIIADNNADSTEVDDELGMNLPYGIQNVRKRKVRGATNVNMNAEHHAKSITYQSLCPTKRISIPLETAGYEYRPNHYIEVTCSHNYATPTNYDFSKNRICSEAGFSCIQLNRTIHLIRRNKAATVECWESEIRIVPSGCECMWPKHSYGDIIAYHEAQKRYPLQENFRGATSTRDYKPGFSYLQLPHRQVEMVGIDGQRRHETDGEGFEAYDFI